MPKKYKNPPIIEALAEFHFSPGKDWDATFPGRLYGKLENSYPVSTPAKTVQATLTNTPAGVVQQVASIDRAQFWSKDRTALVQVGPHFLAANKLKPYVSWEDFRPMIEGAVNAYCSLAEPKGVARAALRYINRIEVPGDRPSLERWYHFHIKGLQLGRHDETELADFMYGVRVLCNESRDMLRVQVSAAPRSLSGLAASVLDIEYAQISDTMLAVQELDQWLENAHQQIEAAFEASITDDLRDVLGRI